MKEGWTREMVDEFLIETKELQRLAVQLGLMILPDWMEEDELKNYLIEQHMVKNPEMEEDKIMKKVENLVKLIKNWDNIKGIETGVKHFEWALTDPERLRDDLVAQYRDVHPEMSKEEREKRVEQEIECITIGAFRRMERFRKTEVVS